MLTNLLLVGPQTPSGGTRWGGTGVRGVDKCSTFFPTGHESFCVRERGGAIWCVVTTKQGSSGSAVAEERAVLACATGQYRQPSGR